MQLHANYNIGNFQIRINWLIAACVCITVLSFARLGLWQLDRAAEKIEAQRTLEQEQRQNAIAIEDIPQGHLHPANPELRNRHVSLSGEYVNERTVLLLAEFFESQIGYGVVTPFRLASNGQLVLVSRGWTTGILAPDTPPYLGETSGPMTITAQIHVPTREGRVFDSEIDPSIWPLRMRGLQLELIEEILAEPLFPFEVRLTPDQPGVLARHWPAVSIDINQNLSYALQWFSFALIVLLAALLTSSNLWQLMKE